MIDREIEDALHQLVRIAHDAVTRQDHKRLDRVKSAIDALATHHNYCAECIKGRTWSRGSVSPGSAKDRVR